MKKATIFLIFILLSITASSFGQDEPETFKPQFKWNFSERLRFVSWDNAITLSDAANGDFHFTRHRTSVGGQYFPAEGLEFAAKITNECRVYFEPDDRDFTINEFIFDQLYVKWQHGSNKQGTLTIGRQNIILGEGFIMMDGGPLDGSRAIYFNAIRYDWKISPATTLTGFYCKQPRLDGFPVVNDQEYELIEEDEEGFGLYLKSEGSTSNLELYVISKNTDTHVESKAHTFGTRARFPIMDKLSFTSELAYQFGKYHTWDRSSIGGHAYFTVKPGHVRFLPGVAKLGTIYLSGLDPDLDEWGAWDPVFARWPKWSESYIYTQIPESGVAYWTNLISYYAQFHFNVTSSVGLNLDYHHLRAPEATFWPCENCEDGLSGDTRGNLFIGKLTWKADKHWSSHLLLENFYPGDFYRNRDSYYWFRFELMYNIAG